LPREVSEPDEQEQCHAGLGHTNRGHRRYEIRRADDALRLWWIRPEERDILKNALAYFADDPT